MKLQLENETHFRAEDLRALVRASLRAVGYDMTCTRFPLKVEVVHARSSSVSGLASLGDNRVHHGLWMKLRLPRASKWTPTTWQRIVAVTVHECMHLVGSRHKDMTEAQRWCTLPLPEWARGLSLREDAPLPVQTKAAARGDRLDHARRMLQKAETRSKRASTIEAKWRRRVRTLER